jgi:hypothetical protein
MISGWCQRQKNNFNVDSDGPMAQWIRRLPKEQKISDTIPDGRIDDYKITRCGISQDEIYTSFFVVMR